MAVICARMRLGEMICRTALVQAPVPPRIIRLKAEKASANQGLGISGKSSAGRPRSRPNTTTRMAASGRFCLTKRS